MKRRATYLLAPLTAVVILLGAWELYVDLGGTDPDVLPPPHAVAAALYDYRGDLWSNLLVTAEEVVLGILAGAVVALGLALVIHLSGWLRRALYPLLVASQAVPIPLIAALLVIWLGFGLGPKLAIIGLISFFPVVVTTLAALDQVDPDLIKLMRTFGAGRGQTFRYVELPSALPGLFTGTKLAAVLSVIGAVFAEWSGANSGLGNLFRIADTQIQTAPEAYAAVVVLALLALLLFALFSAAERWILPWAYHPPR
ncbi:MAG: ABC transporter permease [Solirubrobacterales bacterium]|nr:ABC transporter permease [Solirubrobacterales bacterium]